MIISNDTQTVLSTSVLTHLLERLVDGGVLLPDQAHQLVADAAEVAKKGSPHLAAEIGMLKEHFDDAVQTGTASREARGD